MLKKEVTVFDMREKGASDPGRVRRSGNEFAWNCKMKKGELTKLS